MFADPDREFHAGARRASGSRCCARRASVLRGVDLGERSEGGSTRGRARSRRCAQHPRISATRVVVLTGAAIGGGFMLLTHCDVVVAMVAQRSATPPCRWGSCRRGRWLGGSRRWPARHSRESCCSSASSCRRERLVEAGVVTACVDPDELAAEVERSSHGSRECAALAPRDQGDADRGCVPCALPQSRRRVTRGRAERARTQGRLARPPRAPGPGLQRP